MKLISYKEFGKLRLSGFFFQEPDVRKLENWEFMDNFWVGEAFGFSETLQLQDKPGVTKSISIAFDDAEKIDFDNLLSILKLPLKKGLNKDELLKLFGEKYKTEKFAEDRITYDFIVGEKEKYYVSCTITNRGGLSYIVIMNEKKVINKLESELKNI